jgi:hypothetical protein
MISLLNVLIGIGLSVLIVLYLPGFAFQHLKSEKNRHFSFRSFIISKDACILALLSPFIVSIIHIALDYFLGLAIRSFSIKYTPINKTHIWDGISGFYFILCMMIVLIVGSLHYNRLKYGGEER